MADEGMNIPFNISGNADEVLNSVNSLVKLLTDSILKLSATSKETQGGTKEIKKGAKDTARAVKEETKAVKRARLELQRYKAQRKAAEKAARALNKQAERTGLALKDETRALRESTAIIRKRAIAERKLELLQRKGFDSTGRRIGQYKVEALAIDAVNKRLFKKALAEATARKAMERGIATAKERALIEGRTAAATDRTAAATHRAANATRRYRGEVAKASSQGNRAAFIFRRLFGVLAAFTAARFAITGFFAGVREAIAFNKSIQQAQLGIASLFLAVGQVRNEMGDVVEGAEGLAVAMKESRRQTELLRKDALSTAATFDELLQTFQIGLAPGLAAGLNPDEIRNLAIRISQAASAIGLPMNQLSEEIRSILAGTIQQRTTRIAAALGIRNEDIRNAKRAGQLFSFLSDKFDAFGVAGQKAMDQFFGIVTRVQDALKQLLGAAGLGFFEQLQTLLRETFELLTDSESLIIQPDPRAIAVLEKIFDGFEGAVKNVRDMMDTLSGGDLSAVASAIGTIIEVGSALLLGFVQGIVEAFGIIKQLADPILAVFKAVGVSIPGEKIREVVAALTQVITLMFLWKSIAVAIGVIQKKNLLTSGNLLGFLIVAAVLLDKFLAKLVGVENLNFKDAFSILKLSFLNVVDELIARTTLLFAKALDLVINFISDPLLTLQKLALDAAQTILTALSFVSDAANDALNEVYKKQGENQKKFNDLSKENASAAEAQLDAVIAANDRKMAALFTRIKAEDDARKAEAKGDQDKLRKELDFNGLIAIGLQTLKAEASVINKINESLDEAKKQAAFKGQFGFEISSETKGAVSAFNSAFAKIREDTKKINGQITQFKDGLEGVKANLLQTVEGSREQKELLAQEKAFTETLIVLEEGRAGLANKVIQTMLIKLTLVREEALVHSKIARTIAEEELAATLAVQEARKQGATTAEIELIQIHKRLVALGNEKQLILSRSQADIAFQQKALVFGKLNADQRAEAEETIRDLYAQQGLEIDQINVKMEELKLKAIAVGDEVEDGLVGGMARGFAQFTIQFQSQFQAGVDIARGATESLASFISTAISDAFDPNSDTTLKQRFGQFLQEISNMIIQTLIRLAIAKAILGIVGGPGIASAAGTAAGAAKGGLMEAYAANMSHWSKHAQGLAAGGQPRPKGLHPSDNIPIWAAKGEYMQPADSVRMYGVAAMNALKDKLIDPMALNSLVNSKRSGRGSRKRSMGYAEGGAITEVVSSTKADQAEDQNVGVDRDTPIAALIANDNTMDKILAGGKGAMTRWLEENGYRPHGM